MTDLIESTSEEVTAALDKFERGKAALYRPDGTMKYSEAEHNELLITLTERLHGVAERAHDAAEAEIATVQRLEEARHDDPVAHLSASELATANARALFVREDCEKLPLRELATRLRGIAAAGADKATAFVWSRYAGMRIDGEAERAAAGGGSLAGDDRAHVEAIRAEVVRLAALVAPDNGIPEAEAERRLKRAREAQRALHERVSAADGSQEALMTKMRARYSF